MGQVADNADEQLTCHGQARWRQRPARDDIWRVRMMGMSGTTI
jgi:hypothetical protein